MTAPECLSCHTTDGRPHTEYCRLPNRGEPDVSAISPDVIQQVRQLLNLPEEKAPTITISTTTETAEPFVSWWDPAAGTWRVAIVANAEKVAHP